MELAHSLIDRQLLLGFMWIDDQFEKSSTCIWTGAGSAFLRHDWDRTVNMGCLS